MFLYTLINNLPTYGAMDYFKIVRRKYGNKDVLGRREEGCNNIVDSNSKYVLTMMYPGLAISQGHEYFDCASGAYFKDMSVSVRQNRYLDMVLESYFIFNENGLEHAKPFLKEHDRSKERYSSQFYVPRKSNLKVGQRGLSKDFMKYNGAVGSSFFSVLDYHETTGDIALVISDVMKEGSFEDCPVLEKDGWSKGRPKFTIKETSEEINSVIYNILVKSYGRFEPILK
jgi:hypothetical protein